MSTLANATTALNSAATTFESFANTLVGFRPIHSHAYVNDVNVVVDANGHVDNARQTGFAYTFTSAFPTLKTELRISAEVSIWTKISHNNVNRRMQCRVAPTAGVDSWLQNNARGFAAGPIGASDDGVYAYLNGTFFTFGIKNANVTTFTPQMEFWWSHGSSSAAIASVDCCTWRIDEQPIVGSFNLTDMTNANVLVETE